MVFSSRGFIWRIFIACKVIIVYTILIENIDHASFIVEQFAQAGYQIIQVDICRSISMYSQ